MPVREFEQSEGMAYGVGFDSVSGVVRGDCVVRTEPESPVGVAGQEVVFKLRQITSSSELAKELNISASASLRAAFGKVSAKATYVSQQNINQFSVYLIADVSVTNPTRRMRDIKLTDEAWKLLELKGEDLFRDRCGDEFLSGITTGGEYIAILQITTKTEEERENVSVSVRAKGTGGTWSAGADFKFALESISKEYEVEVTSFQQGGDTTDVPDTVDEIIERAVNFPEQVEGNEAFAFSAFFQDYKALDLPDGRNPIDVENQKRVIEKLADYYLFYSDVLNNIEYVFKNAEQFEDFDSVELSIRANEIRSTLNGLVQSASECFDNYISCKLPDDLPSSKVVLPNRKTIEIRTAIDAAKTAAINAASYAESAKNSASIVIDIASKIVSGSSGKLLADQAQVEVKNAKISAKLARTEADKAIILKSKTDEATKFFENTVISADEAEKALEITVKYAKEAYEIGYRPYWNGPTTLIAFLGGDGSFSTAIRHEEITEFTVCPSGGSVIFVCTGEMKDKNCIISDSSFRGQFDISSNFSGFFSYDDIIPMGVKLPLSFKSSISGLIGSIEFLVFSEDLDLPGYDIWANVPLEIKTIYGREEILNR
jgi:hypothetical protein